MKYKEWVLNLPAKKKGSGLSFSTVKILRWEAFNSCCLQMMHTISVNKIISFVFLGILVSCVHLLFLYDDNPVLWKVPGMLFRLVIVSILYHLTNMFALRCEYDRINVFKVKILFNMFVACTGCLNVLTWAHKMNSRCNKFP